MRTFVKEFQEFIQRGSVIDLAVGIVIGTAFKDIVNSLVNDIVMPPIGLLLNNVDFSNLFINLSDGSYDSLVAAQEAGAATINYGMFINTVINFLIIALVVFAIVRQINALRRRAEKPAPAADPTTKACPYCYSTIPIQATRCPNCTSELSETSPADA
jgi:large conductance mechanosensitive channel